MFLRSKSNKQPLLYDNTMSIDELPTEILERILSLLDLKNLEQCRLVNRHWYDLSRVVLDSIWKRKCQAAFPEASAKARRKSQYKLSWEQLHRSLSLCPHVSEAKITSHSKPLPKVKNWNGTDDHKRQFIVLDNGLVAVPIYSNKKKFHRIGQTIGDVCVYKYEIKPDNDTEELSLTKKKTNFNDDQVYTTQELRKVLDSDTDQETPNKKRKLDETATTSKKSAENNERVSDKICTEDMEICENDNTEKTEFTETKRARYRKCKAEPKTTEVVIADVHADAVKNETTATNRKRGRPKSAKLVIDAVKPEASNTNKQREVHIIETDDSAKTETRKSMRLRSANKNTVAQNSKESVTCDNTAAQNNENDESAHIGGDKVFNKKIKNIKNEDKTSIAKNDDDMNKIITAEIDFDVITKVNYENKEITIGDSVNKENLSNNNNYIDNLNQNAVNPNAAPLESSSNAQETNGKRSMTQVADDDFDMNLLQRQKKRKSEKVNDLMNVPCYNSILYLDMDTLTKQHLETYTFEFNKYAETDEMIVFRSCQEDSCMLIIGYKMEGTPLKLNAIGAMRMQGSNYTDFFILDEDVYYQDEDEILTKVSPKTNAYGDKIPELKKINKFSVKNDESLKEYHMNKITIISIVKVDRNTVNILTDDTGLSDPLQYCPYTGVYMGKCGKMYSLNVLTEQFTDLDVFAGIHDTEDRRVIHNRLGTHGFDFADDRIYAWLSTFVPLTKLKKTVIHRIDKIAIIGNTMKSLFIHCNPYKCSGKKLYLFTAKPTIKIDLKKLENVTFSKSISPGLNKISQIDAVPTINGLKILVLIAEMLVAVDLTHEKKPEYFGKVKPKQNRTSGCLWGQRSWSRRERFCFDFDDDHDHFDGDFDDDFHGDYNSDSDDDGHDNPCSIM